ncbi:MAG: AMIN domain-containing protein [Gemmatimonadaceae bacterium]
MRRVCMLVALAAAALALGPSRVHAAPPRHTVAPATEVSGITALSIVPGEGKADVVIAVSGPVTVQDFTVPSPDRIVLDISGARLTPLARSYDRQVRGGITNVRMSQYRTDVVRVVLDLNAPHAYSVQQTDNGIRVSLESSETFAAWHSVDMAPVATAVADATATAKPAAKTVSTGSVVDAAEPDTVTKKSESAAATQVADAGVIEAPAKAAPPSRPIAQASLAKSSLFAKQSQQSRITVTYQDAEIRDVLAAFASFSGRTIVVGREVKGTVTAEIKDQPWDVALKSILEAQGLAASEETSGIITVDSYDNILKKQASEPLTTQMVTINYVSAGSLVETVRGLLSRDCAPGASSSSQQGSSGPSNCITRGNIAADSATNALLITEVASRLPDLLQYVKQLDIRTPQVALKAKVISVSRTQVEQLGISYDLGSEAAYFNTLVPRARPGGDGTQTDDKEGRITLGGDALAGVANASRKYKQGAALNLLFTTALGNFTLTSFIDALRSQNLSDIQAEPSVVTLDNREARILVGQETPVRVIDAGSAAQIGQPVRANVQFKETGIILTVTPHITNNRQISMKIEAEQSELRVVGGDLGFFIDKRNARTQLLVRDGETAVIGGLTQTQIVKNRSGIPILGDLPLLGKLFSQYDEQEDKKDLLILITPHIIDDGEPVRPPGGNNE